MKIEQQLTEAVIQAVKSLYDADVTAQQVVLQKTKKEFEGHLTLVVFPFAKISRKKPADTAQQIGEWVAANTRLIAGFNAVNGFLNFVKANAVWVRLLNAVHVCPD